MEEVVNQSHVFSYQKTLVWDKQTQQELARTRVPTSQMPVLKLKKKLQLPIMPSLRKPALEDRPE